MTRELADLCRNRSNRPGKSANQNDKYYHVEWWRDVGNLLNDLEHGIGTLFCFEKMRMSLLDNGRSCPSRSLEGQHKYFVGGRQILLTIAKIKSKKNFGSPLFSFGQGNHPKTKKTKSGQNFP
jgi:hypothetical protein